MAKTFIRIIFSNDHQVSNSFRPLVCQSFQKRHIKLSNKGFANIINESSSFFKTLQCLHIWFQIWSLQLYVIILVLIFLQCFSSTSQNYHYSLISLKSTYSSASYLRQQPSKSNLLPTLISNQQFDSLHLKITVKNIIIVSWYKSINISKI